MSKHIDYTAKVRLTHYNKGEETKVIRLGRSDENGDLGTDYAFVIEPTDGISEHYLVGPIADRLYDFESLGYEPEKLKHIINLYYSYRYIVSSTYGMLGEQKITPDGFNLQLFLYEALKNPEKSIHISFEDGAPSILISPWPKGEDDE